MAYDIQTHVIRAEEIVDYSGIVKSAYPYYAMQSEPFIGLRILCKDTRANTTYPAQRIAQIDSFLASGINFGTVTPLHGTGCALRETKYSIMQDGFWTITLPVPRSQFHIQLGNLIRVITMLKQQLGIVQLGYIEINVSGRCTVNDVEVCLNSLHLPDTYMKFSEPPANSPYKIGTITRINDNYVCLRSRWRFDPTSQDMFDNISAIAQIISSIYR